MSMILPNSSIAACTFQATTHHKAWFPCTQYNLCVSTVGTDGRDTASADPSGSSVTDCAGGVGGREGRGGRGGGGGREERAVVSSCLSGVGKLLFYLDGLVRNKKGGADLVNNLDVCISRYWIFKKGKLQIRL